MAQPQIYEGTIEEIATQIRGSNLPGRCKAIVTPDDFSERGDGNMPNLGDALADFLREVDQTEFTPGTPSADPQKQKVGQLIAQKFAKQGHTK